MEPTPVFLPGKSYGQRSLKCYSLWGSRRVGHNRVTKYTHTQSNNETITHGTVTRLERINVLNMHKTE